MAFKNVVCLFMLICVVVSANAQLSFPLQPGSGLPGLPDILKCWSTIINVPGCIVEIPQSIFTGHFGHIGPACCKAMLEVDANCLSKIPFNQFIPRLLKEQCLRTVGETPPTRN